MSTSSLQTGSHATWGVAETVTFRDLAIAFAWSLLIMAPILGFGGRAAYVNWRALEDARIAKEFFDQSYERVVAAPPLAGISIDHAMHGRELFMTVCNVCHGSTGLGIEGMGKALVSSDFVASLNDDQLRDFIITGRPDAKPMPMPPRAGRPDLTNDDLASVVAYVRGLQDPRRMPELPAYVANVIPTQEEKDKALAAAGGDPELAAYIASGNKLFHSTCVACHGKGGVGVQGNGKTLVNNSFIRSKDDDALLAFIKVGRMPTDPASTTGIQMPPKGGNPAFNDDDLLDIISYLRTLQDAKTADVGNTK